MERGYEVRARCGQCGHPRPEHRVSNQCTVPKCTCLVFQVKERESRRANTGGRAP